MFKDHLIEGLSKTQKMFLGTNNPKGNTLKALTDHEDSGSETESDSEYESEDPFVSFNWYHTLDLPSYYLFRI